MIGWVCLNVTLKLSKTLVTLTEEFNKYSLKMAFESNKLFRAQRAEKSRWKG